MNKLESEVYQWVAGVDKYNYALDSEKEFVAKEIAKIALKIAEKAYRQGTADELMGKVSTDKEDFFDQFKQEIL